MVSLKYTLLKEDYVNYYAYVLWDAPGNRKKRILHYAKQLVPIGLFLFAFYYTGILDRSSRFVLLIMAAILITALLSLFGLRSIMLKQGKKIADDPGNSSIFLETQLLANESGIILKDSLKELRYGWAAFIRKEENAACYMLFTSSLQGIIIPKRVFDANEKAQFDKLLAQYLSFDADLGHLVKS